MKTNILKYTTTLALIFGLFIGQSAIAQKKKDMTPEKIGFYTEKIGLTSDEAQLLWPLLNEMQEEYHQIRVELKGKRNDKKYEEMTDKEIEEMLDMRMDFGKKQMDIKMKYHEKLKEILPIKKVAKYYQASNEYKKLHSRKSSGNKPPHGKPQIRANQVR